MGNRFCYFPIILLGKKELVILMFSDCWCSVSLPRGVMGWSVECDCGISWSYSLFNAFKPV